MRLFRLLVMSLLVLWISLSSAPPRLFARRFLPLLLFMLVDILPHGSGPAGLAMGF